MREDEAREARERQEARNKIPRRKIDSSRKGGKSKSKQDAKKAVNDQNKVGKKRKRMIRSEQKKKRKDKQRRTIGEPLMLLLLLLLDEGGLKMVR